VYPPCPAPSRGRGSPEKKSLHASERKKSRIQQARASYWQAITATDARRLKFVDESGVKLAMTRVYGHAPKGERVVEGVHP
jgi:hypothetical protein